MTLEDEDGHPAADRPGGASYRVTANSFLAAGGDNFAAFRDGDRTVSTPARTTCEELVEYFEEPGCRRARTSRSGRSARASTSRRPHHLFAVEAPEEIGPGELKTATVTIDDLRAAIEDELFSIGFGFGVPRGRGLRGLRGPRRLRVRRLRVRVRGPAAGHARRSSCRSRVSRSAPTQPGFIAAFLDSPVFDGNPIEEPLRRRRRDHRPGRRAQRPAERPRRGRRRRPAGAQRPRPAAALQR